MVNTELLKEKIKASGLKIEYIAEQLGVSRQSFYNKANNRVEFTSSEVVTVCNILSITKLTEKETIFFAKEVT